METDERIITIGGEKKDFTLSFIVEGQKAA